MGMTLGAPGAALLCGLALATGAQATCDRNLLAEVPVTMRGLVPVVTAQINGVNAAMIFDTGATESLLHPGADEMFHLTRDPNQRPLQGRSNGRTVNLVAAEAAQFAFAGQTYSRMVFDEPDIGFGLGIEIGRAHV